MAKRNHHSSQPARPHDPVFDPGVPTHDFLAHINLDDPGGIDEALENLIQEIESGYFLRWEGVLRQEQGLPLSNPQKKALANLLDFSDDDDNDDDRILYIDEIPRPTESWYDIARKIVPGLLMDPFQTDAGTYWAVYEGWPTLVETLDEHGQDLSLPAEVSTPLDIFPLDLQHRLWLQTCFDALSGLGQDQELTLENEDQQHRVESFIELLRDHKDTVHYFDLTLESLLSRLIMQAKDEAILIRMMTEQLRLTSPQEPLANYL